SYCSGRGCCGNLAGEEHSLRGDHLVELRGAGAELDVGAGLASLSVHTSFSEHAGYSIHSVRTLLAHRTGRAVHVVLLATRTLRSGRSDGSRSSFGSGSAHSAIRVPSIGPGRPSPAPLSLVSNISLRPDVPIS
ncbi:hypothetical protein PFISCL1PPCAC_17282, partial [Pristionchus fissidentatus]